MSITSILFPFVTYLLIPFILNFMFCVGVWFCGFSSFPRHLVSHSVTNNIVSLLMLCNLIVINKKDVILFNVMIMCWNWADDTIYAVALRMKFVNVAEHTTYMSPFLWGSTCMPHILCLCMVVKKFVNICSYELTSHDRFYCTLLLKSFSSTALFLPDVVSLQGALQLAFPCNLLKLHLQVLLSFLLTWTCIP
jgi:hypothetical protein